MFKAHINVEFCHSVKKIKYICDYIKEGNDRAMFTINDDEVIDEIKAYEHGRYISSNEAI